MRLTVLSVPGCPHVALLEDRLAEVIGRRPGVPITHRLIHSEEQAARYGMHGSPTLLVNGVDPFASPGQPTTVSCRLYPHDGGGADGAPSSDQIRDAIGARGEDID
jgi:hypothetical protein